MKFMAILMDILNFFLRIAPAVLEAFSEWNNKKATRQERKRQAQELEEFNRRMREERPNTMGEFEDIK